MRAIAWLLRVFCYLFHAVLSLSVLGLGGLATMAGAGSMKLQSLPWQGPQLNNWLIGLGILGLICVILAMRGTLRILLVLWSIFIFVILVRNVFLSPAVTFAGQDDFHDWLWLAGGAFLAMIGSLLTLRRRA